jgi:hypothetical protein
VGIAVEERPERTSLQTEAPNRKSEIGMARHYGLGGFRSGTGAPDVVSSTLKKWTSQFAETFGALLKSVVAGGRPALWPVLNWLGRVNWNPKQPSVGRSISLTAQAQTALSVQSLPGAHSQVPVVASPYQAQ